MSKSPTRDKSSLSAIRPGAVRTAKAHPTEVVKAGTATLQAPVPVALPAHERGITRAMDREMRVRSKMDDLYIETRNSNPAALRHMAKPDAFPKPMSVKAKTEKGDGPNAGIALEGGKKYYADLDLHTVRRVAKPEHDVNDSGLSGEDFRRKVNPKMRVPLPPLTKDTATGRPLRQPHKQVDMVQHGSHDDWADRNDPAKAKGNVGPQGNSTAYVGGKAYHLPTIESQKNMRVQQGMPFPYTADAISKSKTIHGEDEP